MSEIEVHQGSTLTLESDQTFWTDHQIAGLRQLGIASASNGDLAVYLHVCQRTGLDPFARQIYLIERQGKQTIQTGIDGFRLVARRAVDRTGELLSIGASEWCDQDGVWTDVWLKDSPPAAARVIVRRGDGTFPGTALWREYAQTKRDGSLTSMWETRSAGQLAKCAEALALRKAFPHDLSGIYTDDELASTRREERKQSNLTAALAAQSSDPDPGDSPPAEPDAAPLPADQGEPSGSEPVDAEEVETITDAQLRNIGRLLGAKCLNITDRDEQFVKISVILGREVTTRKHLSKEDGMRLIDGLDAELTARAREQ